MNIKKLIISVGAAFCLLIPAAFAATSVEFTIGECDVYSLKENVSKTVINAAPYIKNDRTMVPVRALCEIFGSDVSWDSETNAVSISKDGKYVILDIGSDNIYVNGEKKQIDCAPEIVNDTTFIPLRAVSENLGYYVYYVGATGQIIIDDIAPVINVANDDIAYNEFAAMYNLNYNGNTSEQAAFVNNLYSSFAKLYAMYYNAQQNSISLTDDEIQSLKSISAKIKNSDISNLNFLPASYVKIQHDYMVANKYVDHIYDSISIDDEDLEKLYNENYVCAKHVLILTGNDRSDEDALKLAQDIYRRAAAGEDFDLLVSQYGEDPGMKTNPNGYVFTYNEMVKEFEQASFELEPGQVSQPVKTSYGYHVILKMPLPEDKDTLENVKQKVIGNIYNQLINSIYENTPAYINIPENEFLPIINNK